MSNQNPDGRQTAYTPPDELLITLAIMFLPLLLENWDMGTIKMLD